MQSRFMIERPDDVVATMKITMTVKEWGDLRDQLADRWPSADLSRHITDLLCAMRKVIYVMEDTP